MLIYKPTQVLTQERRFERKFSLLDAKKPHSQRKNGAIIFGKIGYTGRNSSNFALNNFATRDILSN